MIYEFEGVRPKIGKGTYVSPSAEIIGDVVIGENCYIGPCAVIRGNEGAIRIGNGTAIEDLVMVHPKPGGVMHIGDYVTVGHSAILHCQTIEDYVVVGMGAIVSVDAAVGKWSFIGEGAVVKMRQEIPADAVAVGAPAKIVREVTEPQKEHWMGAKNTYIELSRKCLNGAMVPVAQEDCV